MKKKTTMMALIPALMTFGVLSLNMTTVQAADEICTFKTDESHFSSLLSPPEPMAFKWRKSTGKVLSFYWLHGGVKWFSYKPNKGTVMPDLYPGDYHHRVNLGTTTTGFETTRYQILGYVQTNKELPNATFAGTWEGTGSAWFVAYGNLNCVAVP